MKHILEKLLDSYKSKSVCQVQTFKMHRDMMNTLVNKKEHLHIKSELLELEQMFKDRLSVIIVRQKILEIIEMLDYVS